MVKNQAMTNRKNDHLKLAHMAQLSKNKNIDFYYEPLWADHSLETDYSVEFLGKKLAAPFWISSMTGGAELAQEINTDLAELAQSYGIGMGLGSCRAYLENNRQNDFKVRDKARNIPLMANLGIAQVEAYLSTNSWSQVEEMLEDLGADALMIHINPLQEWFQPEGDRYKSTPLETLYKLKEVYSGKLGVKEVGQGFGPHSLSALVNMDIDIIELAGFGGTNFTKLEKLRSEDISASVGFENIGHHWQEMVTWLNKLYKKSDNFPEIIISGGIRTPLEAALALKTADFKAIIGMGYPFLKWQKEGKDKLALNYQYFYDNWVMAMKTLEVKKD
jgi:isopentenyl-diphosphate delta-isomerase